MNDAHRRLRPRLAPFVERECEALLDEMAQTEACEFIGTFAARPRSAS